jgi:UDP-3-O-[3-hydroxymyristoyl] N-acetylglucosamine deacetylase
VSERFRRTLASPSDILSGVGLHSGKSATVRLLPTTSGEGVVLRDLDSGQEITAHALNVFDTSRCTILGKSGITVQTVEHLLSALAALGVDDVLVETQGGEFPAVDGSAAPFVSLIRAAGTAEHGGVVFPLRLDRPRLLQSEDGSTLLALPSPMFQATVVLDYPKYPWIGTQVADYDSFRDDYASEIAPARTYGFLGEIAWLQARGLALGASRENGIALRADGYDTTLRFDNELARHKLLDLIGDLSLIGRPLAARVIAVKPSHALNCRFARLLAEDAA